MLTFNQVRDIVRKVQREDDSLASTVVSMVCERIMRDVKDAETEYYRGLALQADADRAERDANQHGEK